MLEIKHIAHGDSRFLLRGGGYTGIGVQSKSSGEVAEDGGHGLDVHAVLQCYRSEGVAEVVKANLGDTCSCQHPLQHVVDTDCMK